MKFLIKLLLLILLPSVSLGDDFDPNKIDNYTSGIPFLFKLVGWPLLIGVFIFMIRGFFTRKENNESIFDHLIGKLFIAVPIVVIFYSLFF